MDGKFDALQDQAFKANYKAEFYRTYRRINKIFIIHKLMPNTICTFDLIFRRYLRDQFTQICENKNED